MNKVLIYDVIKSIEVNNKIFYNFKNSNDLEIVQNEINKYYIESGFEESSYIEIILTSNQNKNAENIILNSGEYGDSSMGWDIETNTLDKYLVEHVSYDCNNELFDEKLLINKNINDMDNISIQLNHYQYSDWKEPNINFKIEQYIEHNIMFVIENIIYDKKSNLSIEDLKEIFNTNTNLKLLEYLLSEKYTNQINICNYVYALNNEDLHNIDFQKILIELKDDDLKNEYTHSDKYIKELTKSNINLDLQSFLTLKLNSLNRTIEDMSMKYE
jgi:hypothetical protein